MKYNPDIHHRRSVRLKNYDYSQRGLYFITICTNNRVCLFGEVKNDEIILNDAGEIARVEWFKTERLRPDVKCDAFVIMPNHVHGIVVIRRGNSGNRFLVQYQQLSVHLNPP
jgi:REP-associated tyrosine transposase